jgi:hypothetical protein
MAKHSLQDVQVGDQLAPMRVDHRENESKWTGTLRGVTKVTPKFIFMGSQRIEKGTGREPGLHGASHYIVATPDMIAEFNQKQAERDRREREVQAFYSREDYRHASAIAYKLSAMTVGHHPLDCMTPEEWHVLRIKICGPIEAGGEID